MEVLVADDGFHALEVGVGGGVLARQYRRGIEDVEALVLHGAHIEVANGHDHVDVEVVLQAKAGFVPLHRTLHRAHGERHLVLVCRHGPDFQRHLAAAGRGVAVFLGHQLAGDQREQVGRLAVRVHPFHPVALLVGLAFAHLVAVGQQHRVLLLVGDDGGSELGHHVRTVRVVGDLAEAFRLALGVQVATGRIQAVKAGIGYRVDLGFDIQNEAVRHVGNAQTFGVLLVGAGLQLVTVQHHRQQRGAAVQFQHVGRGRSRVAVNHHAGVNAGLVVVHHVEGEVDLVHQVGGRQVIFAVFDLRLLLAHERAS